MPIDSELSTREILDKAEVAEAVDDVATAIKLYEQVVRTDQLNEYAYNRLMVLYRKLKDYKTELKIINNGIKSFEKFYASKRSRSKKIVELSDKLNKSFGLVDKTGNSLYDPEPISGWKKRKATVEKKIK